MPDLQQSDNNCNDLLFALTLFNTNRKIMIQGNHRELWVEREFPLLKDLVSETSQGKDLMMLCKEATGTSMDHVSFDDLDESDSENNDQTDPDPNSAENQVRRSPGPMIDESIRLFDDEDFGDDDSDKVSFDKLDLKTFTPKSRKGQPGKKQKKADKKKVQFKPKNISVFELDSRIKAMEDFTSKIDSVISGKLTEIVMQEGLIYNIVKVRIKEELKDLKIKHKNSLSILERKLQDNGNSFNIKLTKIESELETLRGKLATTIEKLSRLERVVKNNSDNRNEITITSQDLQNHGELINKLKEENTLISNDLNHLFSRLSEEERKCDSLQSLYSSISNKENELIENIKTIKFELDTLKTPDQTITIEGRPPDRSDVPQFDNSKTPDQPMTNGNEPPKRNDIPQLDKSKKFTHDYQDCDTVLLMDSNRRFIDTNRLFPGKKSPYHTLWIHYCCF